MKIAKDMDMGKQYFQMVTRMKETTQKESETDLEPIGAVE